MRISDSTILVTGAASGLGAAVAQHLAGAGARVVGIDVSTAVDRASGARDALRTADVTCSEQVRAVLDEIDQKGPPLRGAVNCAGIAPSSRIVPSSAPPDLALFERVVRVNLVGTFTVLALAAQRIARTAADSAGERGAIVNTASIAAYEGQVGQVAYAASKAGVVGMTLSAARDLARHGIRVNTIAPGVLDTPMVAAFSEEVRDALASTVPFPPRLGTPAEFARLVQFLLEHPYMNGEVIRMDGALRMGPR